MRLVSVCALALVCVVLAHAEVIFEENFSKGWDSRWTVSDWKKADGTQGEWKWTAGKWHGDANAKGIQTSQDARFYAISAPFAEHELKDKPLVLQFTVKHEQKLDCGGGYIKLLSPGFEPKKFNGDTPYAVMFGPDICGTSTRRTHVILSYKGTNHLVKREVRCETDQLTHLYTLILRPDNTYEVLIDGKKEQSGSLYDDFDMLPAKQIPDPSASKPADWVDEKTIPDPEDVKPADWDSIPKLIPDMDAEQPEDWDAESDGEWERPQKSNPEYKGEWKQKTIPNPAYKGEWKAPLIDNPEYVHDAELVNRKFAGVGIELWQVKSGTLFNNILVTDDVDYAKAQGEKATEGKDEEKAMFDKEEEARRAKEDEERKKAEEERKEREAKRKAEEDAKKASQPDDDDEDDDEEDEVVSKKPHGHNDEL